jgi:hypothetical protein
MNLTGNLAIIIHESKTLILSISPNILETLNFHMKQFKKAIFKERKVKGIKGRKRKDEGKI